MRRMNTVRGVSVTQGVACAVERVWCVTREAACVVWLCLRARLCGAARPGPAGPPGAKAPIVTPGKAEGEGRPPLLFTKKLLAPEPRRRRGPLSTPSPFPRFYWAGRACPRLLSLSITLLLFHIPRLQPFPAILLDQLE